MSFNEGYFDGSFVCEAALRRFLARCPGLQSSPDLDVLVKKGDPLTPGELVEALAQPFLHPSYTIPIMGCFRPISRSIIDKAVALLDLCRCQTSLKLNSGEDDAEIDEKDVHVVDFYARRERGLRLHEVACLALCRALDLAPFLLGSILNYFRFSPPPFQRFSAADSFLQFDEKNVHHSLDIVHVAFRFLIMEPKVFSMLWDWSCFLDLVRNYTAGLGAISSSSLLKEILDMRWCGIHILSFILRMGDRATKKIASRLDEARVTENFAPEADEARATKKFYLGADEAPCFLRWEEFCQDTPLEKAGWYFQPADREMTVCHDSVIDFSQYLQSFDNESLIISSPFSHEYGSRKRRKKSSCNVKSAESPFILTSAVKKSFEMVLMAISQKWPVLLHGPPGAGKTALINKLAKVKEREVLFIHMDEQMDSKSLIGNYICSEQPGEFRWQPGSLTQAVMNGFWVVFEDIDKAPSDVQAILLPLLEGSSSFVTGHGEAINVAESFRLFATVSSSKLDLYHGTEGRLSYSVLWRKVAVGTANYKDLLDIVNVLYPSLEHFSTRLVDTLDRVNSVTFFQSRGFQVGGVASPGVLNRFSLRHLLKWCKRIASLTCDFSGLALSASDCKNIYHEAVDVFASSSLSSENRLTFMKEIAKIWGIPLPEAENLYPPNKPTIQHLRLDLRVGRITLQCSQAVTCLPSRPFVNLRSSLHVLEKIGCSVKHNEPVLLVGETGTGKTTLVQNLAMRLGQPLTVLNLSQQSDVSDLLGGFKPTDARSLCIPLHHEFKALFCRTFSEKENTEVLGRYEKYATDRQWKKLLYGFYKAVDIVQEKNCKSAGSKRRRPLSEEILKAWESFSVRVDAARKQIAGAGCISFSFVEGAFIKALKNGHWILLDEVNLAPQETLQRIIGVLDGENGTLCLTERGDVNYVVRHSHFRIFACMNPATDAGKRDLPHSFRSRFTEYFVDDFLDDKDLSLFINQYLDDISSEVVSRIVHFYKTAKKESEERLQDGANQKPQFSLRSLARALEYTRKAKGTFVPERALYDGFCMFFLTLLDGPSSKIMNKMIFLHLLGHDDPQVHHCHRNVPFDAYLTQKSSFGGIPNSSAFVENYVLTRSVKEHLRNLARAVYIKRYPVLLQGPTSSGKTSLVQYLASVTGHEFVRINNHEHTDLQEYFGSYITNSYGRLEFQEGVLVKAVRKGYWIVLDELNLAPSDVLEALNRLLDDNRELFVPELQETVTAHPDFMLFATQNPPTLYAGRKMLSRAFRNRFLEIHVDEIPENELGEILEQRCKIPRTYATKMVDVMKDLQLHRQNSKVFAGKHGFITPRDLFRWADRFRMFGKSYTDLAKDGYFLLAERLWEESEKNVVQEVLEQRLRVKLSTKDLYFQESAQEECVYDLQKHGGVLESLGNIVWTPSMWRLYFLVERCYKLREPVLLVGETGGGKTTVCQLLSSVLQSRLHILNCHQYTETSDFLGGFHPVRDRSRLAEEFRYCVEKVKLSKLFLYFSGDIVISSDMGQASSTLNWLNEILNRYKQHKTHPNISKEDLDDFEQVKNALMELEQKWQTLFLWQDGPLVQAMKDGDLFLVDEISLADDSVLERLNSVLEPGRKLSLAEKGGSVLEDITAHPNFFVLATMNPGGDYGKKELSPALRNRFTEIWVPSVSDSDELRSIGVARFIRSELSCFVDPMLKFWEWFNQLQTGRMLTVRDILSWVSFINVTEGNLGSNCAFIHGAFLVLLDGLSLGTSISKSEVTRLRESCLAYLLEQLKAANISLANLQMCEMETYGWGDGRSHADDLCSQDVKFGHLFGISAFYIAKGDRDCEQEGFEFLAPTTRRNALRVLRAMQLPKPVLLEGSPGVGKTSLVVALAKFSGHSVVRINLSEQTDMMDLLGSDLPVEGETGMDFAWSDGILLQALKKGCWVLLDELNLAPQSVLEGLNAILDHRAEVYIPELGFTFKCPASFRVFACQNPSSQGGGRKGLPKSFLNRFTKVYVDELAAEDYLFICRSRHQSIPTSLLPKLIRFNNRLYEDTMLLHKYGQDGSPWEFNLRDVIRACQIIEGAPENVKAVSFLNVVYLQRLRTAADRKEVLKLYEEAFGVKALINHSPRVQISPDFLIIGDAFVSRNHFQPTKLSKTQLNMLPRFSHCFEAALHCIRHQWLCILVGPPSSGKTSLIRLLAHVTGNALHELNLSSGTDVSELIGCFEQYNAFQSCSTVICQVERYVDEYCSLCSDLIIERKELIARWLAFLKYVRKGFSPSSSLFIENWKSGCCNLLNPLVEIIEQLKLDLEKLMLTVSWSCEDLDRSLKIVLDLQENNRKQSSTKFEWVAGGLIRAIEHGEWVVLDNANLCNPTVLDRINSLVEPNGSITINECGLVHGNPVVLNAHPKFRMFLTVDPRYGEVSRAMRNRGLEIYMMEPNCLVDGEIDYDCKINETENVKRFLTQSGIPFGKLIDAMAEAHMHAKDAGLHLGVHITLLELSRWVQLFQQLIMNGNQPTWSLQLSWEHTYLSSLGEGEGKDIIKHAKLSYLSEHKWYKVEPLNEGSLYLPEGGSLSLPGGWPTPHSSRNLMWFSREEYVKQNCMYLEFLGAQYASYELSNGCSGPTLLDTKKLKPAMIPLHLLHHILFPNAASLQNFSCAKPASFDLTLADKMLFISSKWVIEQATESDLEFYIQWFKWYSSQLQPHCQILKSITNILLQEQNHPIWKHIKFCGKVISNHLMNVGLPHISLLSLESLQLAGSIKDLEMSQEPLDNAIQCVGLLRHSLQQWNDEKDYAYREESQGTARLLRNDEKDYLCAEEAFRLLRNDEKDYFFKEETFRQLTLPVFESLGRLEKELLKVIVDSPCFDQLIHVYSDLLEHHALFWKGVTCKFWKSVRCCFDWFLIAWYYLKKEAIKLQIFFPEAVDALLRSNLNSILTWNVRTSKPMLWVHGGHPFLPSSADICHKVQQLWNLCAGIWPRMKFLKKDQNENYLVVETLLSANAELRHVTFQGICMSSYVIAKHNQDNNDVVNQLEEIHKRLLRKTEHERNNLKMVLLSTFNNPVVPIVESSTAGCCVFSPEILCTKPGLDCWLEILPLFDRNSLFLDMELLQDLSRSTMFESHELHQALSRISDCMQYALDYSLSFSSRCPTDFLPYQEIIWILDAWPSVDFAHVKYASLVQETWFNWHFSLWSYYSAQLEKFLPTCFGETCLLVQPIRLATIDQILQGIHQIRDYDSHCLKIRATSQYLWQHTPAKDFLDGLLSAARSLFQQIICAHKKSFEEVNFGKIKSIFWQHMENPIPLEMIQHLRSLILSSSHSRLSSLMDDLIDPLLKELYAESTSHGRLHNLGLAWVNLGVLRFHLLLNADSPDPVTKFSFKHSLLVEKISLLELEIKVRQECEHLAGRCSARDDQKQRVCLLQRLEEERKRLQAKVVFRPDPANFENLKSSCVDFLEIVSKCKVLVDADPLKIVESQSWQVTSANFICQLSKDYAPYADIIQPIQVAVYEMKLGLSLVMSGALQRESMRKVKDWNHDRILAIVYSLFKFPRVFQTEASHVDLKAENDTETMLAINANELMNLVTILSDNSPDKESVLQLQAIIHHNTLIYVAYRVCSSLLIDNSSFLQLSEVFDHFSNLWMDLKFQKEEKEDGEGCNFKFRPRALKIEEILKVDFTLVSNSDSYGSEISEWVEMSVEQDFTKMKGHAKEDEHLEEEWNLMQDSILKSVVCIHNQLFGSSDLLEHPGVFQVSNDEKLHSFVNFYRLGTHIIKGISPLTSSNLDEKLVPEHLLRICLEFGENMNFSYQSTNPYNFYKDSNAAVMSKMVRPLVAFQERIRSLLDEWPGHPGLQKLLDLTEMLLAIPLNSPLSKALFGLQCLLGRAKFLQENASNFSLIEHLQPIYSLVSAWQKNELDCWPALLRGVEEQYDVNAGKLWFPLRSVLQCKLSGDASADSMFTIQSLEEFIQTSSIGEYKKRLQLLLSFHGQFKTGIHLNAYASPQQKKILNILYNVFGYYVQFLPIVLQHIEADRKCKEKEIKDCMKLFQWEDPFSYLSIENFRKTRHKFWKLIQKFNAALQEPVMVLLNQETKLNGEQKLIVESDAELVQFPMDLTQFSSTERWAEGWISLEKVWTSIAEFGHNLKLKSKNHKKRRALVDLLKILESCGLSRHRTLVFEMELNLSQPTGSFLQESFDVQHLLHQESVTSNEQTSVSARNAQMPCDSSQDLKWEIANQYYFKNLAVLQQLRQVCMKFHTDLSLEQVNRASSFLNHLIGILQDQRLVLYAVSEQLKKLKRQFSSLEKIGFGEFSLSPNQCSLLKCMWQQKNLFDNLLVLSKDVCLLLGCVVKSHLGSCNTVKIEAEMTSTFVQKFGPVFLKTKESLDRYLLGSDGILTTSIACEENPSVVSKLAEEHVLQNFQIVDDFEEDIRAFLMSSASKRSVKDSLLNHFKELIHKGKIIKEEYFSRLVGENQSEHICSDSFFSMENFNKLEATFAQTCKETNKKIKGASENLDLLCKRQIFLEASSAEKITSWSILFESYMVDLKLDVVCDLVRKTMVTAGELLNYAGHRNSEVCSQVEIQLKHLHVSLDHLLSFANGVFLEFLAVHKTVAEMSYLLGRIFMSLFSKGFGDPEEQVENSGCENSQDATGTGMGEGEGMNDVSNQIDDESQLLGTSEKQHEGLENSEAPNKDERGIEMDEDFTADTFSVSEDSGDENSDEEDINLDSVMGESADGNQVVDEKIWDKQQDGDPDNSIEKYESGPSVKERDTNSRELRAKEDTATAIDESGESDDENCDRFNGTDDNPHISEDEDNCDDMKMDKNNAFEDPTGIQFDEQKQNLEDVNMDEPQDLDTMGETSSGPDETEEEMEDEGQSNLVEEHVDEDLKDEVDGQVDSDKREENANNEDADLSTGMSELEKMENIDNPASGTDTIHAIDNPCTADPSVDSKFNSCDLPNGLALSSGLPPDDVPRKELAAPDWSNGSKLAHDQPKLQVSHDTSSVQKSQPNPYRSLGDALERWKERVEISDNLQEPQSEAVDDLEDENADEYQFVCEMEKGTSQALGPATSDQIGNSIERNKCDADENNIKKKEDDGLQDIGEDLDKLYIRRCEASIIKQKTDEKLREHLQETQVRNDPSMEASEGDGLRNNSGYLVSFKDSYMNEKGFQPRSLTSESQLTEAMEIEKVSDNKTDSAVADWRRYELATTRMSQELAEQLRLVMEPTLASKLQGDYKTGKRINMKKVIPYIASHFRKDKIWLRRTRPNKRDYQVVVAVDDSRSMSESRCGNVAIEATVTVCRAMSQLEVGQLAVVSFGERGNIRLLHDFGQPFTGEAGIKMISSLSFKQDNTIADEPVVDLLKFLNNMLDTAVAKSRLPSGSNPLQQLILIIADGRFHEKENLKRCVRDALSRNRMIAFLLVDSPQESIMDLMEASFQDNNVSLTKYLNSFPFPYYVVLKSIEALPRTLADLLRQWFELMQNVTE